MLGLAWIAAATTASLAVAALLNAWLLHRHHAGLDARATTVLVVRALALAVVAAAAGLGARESLPALPSVALAALCTAVVGGTYLLGLIALRAPGRLLVGETLHALRQRR